MQLGGNNCTMKGMQLEVRQWPKQKQEDQMLLKKWQSCDTNITASKEHHFLFVKPKVTAVSWPLCFNMEIRHLSICSGLHRKPGAQYKTSTRDLQVSRP